MAVANCSPQTDDAKHRHLMPLSESTSLSQVYEIKLIVQCPVVGKTSFGFSCLQNSLGN